jgi:hypothetical protein
MRGAPHVTGSLGSCAELDYVAFSEGPEIAANIRGISGSNARRKLGGAKRGRCRVALFRDIAASRTRISTSNPQEPVAAVEAQATRHVLLANRKLVAKHEDLRLQGSTGSELEATKAKRATKKKLIVGSQHGLANSRNPCVFRSDGVFGKHKDSNSAILVSDFAGGAP